MLKVVADEGEPVSDITSASSRLTRSKIDAKNNCFFCDGDKGNMHLSATKELDTKVRSYACLTEDERLNTKLPEGGSTAIDSSYHLQRLVNLRKKVRQYTVGSSSNDHVDFDEGSLASAKVVNYIKSKCTKDVTNVTVFKLPELKTIITIHRGQLINAQ